MRIIVTLDYELFFGKESGTAKKCIIDPTNELIRIGKETGIKFVFFVDVGYLICLEREIVKWPELEKDHLSVVGQISELVQLGHEIQLHIHPHWENTYYKNGRWDFDTTKYKLADFSDHEIIEIVTRYKDKLEEISNKEVFAYRAGGWSIQPFKQIGEALRLNNVWLDSTVYPGGKFSSIHQSYDFRNCPNQTIWNFDDDPTEQLDKGYFTEIPIAAHHMSPIFFWNYLIKKITKNEKLKSFGDGIPIPSSKLELIKKLLLPTHSVVSIDGIKSSFIEKAFNKYMSQNKEGYFVIIGHPKSLTKYSLEKLRAFIKKYDGNHKFVTYNYVKEVKAN